MPRFASSVRFAFALALACLVPGATDVAHAQHGASGAAPNERHPALPQAQDARVTAADALHARFGAEIRGLFEERIVSGMEQSAQTHLALIERLRAVEKSQTALITRLEAELAAGGSPPADSGPGLGLEIDAWDSTTGWASLAALLTSLALLFALRRRRQVRARGATPRPQRAAPSASPRAEAAAPLLFADEPGRSDRSEPHPAPQAAPGENAPFNWDASETQREPPPPLPSEPQAAEETAEEHESAIELADIMIGFGRIQGAAETLAEFIQSNPRQAVTPWLKLLEVYRAAGLRPEFDALARRLNKTFNVKAVTWDTFDEARRTDQSIEQLPHAIGTIQKLWGTTECQGYLERLLRDNRDGTRQGFPLAVIDEILVLSKVLEDQLGPWRPPKDTTDPVFATMTTPARPFSAL